MGMAGPVRGLWRLFFAIIKGKITMGVLRTVIGLVKEIFSDYALLFELSKKDLQKRFSGTYFGLVWGILQPLMTVLVYWAAFRFGLRSGPVDGYPFTLWFVSGMVVWVFFSETLSAASGSFLEYSYLIKKVRFNISILPLVKILSGYYMHLLFLGIVLGICILGGAMPGAMLAQIVYYSFASISLLFSLTLIMASVMVFFKDLQQIINLILLVGMWGTPIVWNLNMFPLKVQMILKINPIYYLVEGYRDALLGRGWFWDRPLLGLYYWLVVLVMMFFGVSVFSRLRPYFADTV